MSGRGILDADMRTIGALIVRGWEWWLEELRGLVPSWLRPRQRDDFPRLLFENDALVPQGAVSMRGRVDVLVPARLCLIRTIERPMMSDRNLRRMLAFEGGTLLPFPGGTTIVAGRNVGVAAPGRIRIEMAGLPVATARSIADAADAVAARVVRVVVLEDGRRSAPLDFAPAMIEAGILARARSATPLIWALVGFLVALNIGAIVWRDVASVNRLEQITQDQQPAVLVAQKITRRAEQDRTLAVRTRVLRVQHDALGDLAMVSRTLPDGAWLQRYVWDGATLRLAGYKPPKVDVASALRHSGRFAEVRSMADETQAAVAVGDPFDVSARIVRR
jgi:hypothetical protein